MVVYLIKGFFLILGYLSGVVQLGTFIYNVSHFVQNVVTYVPQMVTYIGYVYFFVPKATLQPLIAVAISCCMIRLFMAIVNLVWW